MGFSGKKYWSEQAAMLIRDLNVVDACNDVKESMKVLESERNVI